MLEGNGDLWDEFVTELRLRTTRHLDFVWVKGYPTKVHIDREITTTLDTRLQTHRLRITKLRQRDSELPLSTHMFVAELFSKDVIFLLPMSEVDHG